jgi:hypothetical protein
MTVARGREGAIIQVPDDLYSGNFMLIVHTAPSLQSSSGRITIRPATAVLALLCCPASSLVEVLLLLLLCVNSFHIYARHVLFPQGGDFFLEVNGDKLEG